MTTRIAASAVLCLALVPAPAVAQTVTVQCPPSVTVNVYPAPACPATPAVAPAEVAPPVSIVPVPIALADVAPTPAPTADPWATTELHFTSADDESYVISVFRDDPEIYDYEALCTTPCTVQIENGMYDFMAGGHRTFEVYATGGVQYWRVEDNNQSGIIAGAVLTGLGPLLPVAGWGLYGLGFLASCLGGCDDDGADFETTMYTLGGIGAGMAIIGLVTWLTSYGSAEQYQPGDGTIPIGNGIGIVPAVYAQPDDRGGRDWGLGLGLRF